jgi:hypothetical protein
MADLLHVDVRLDAGPAADLEELDELTTLLRSPVTRGRSERVQRGRCVAYQMGRATIVGASRWPPNEHYLATLNQRQP